MKNKTLNFLSSIMSASLFAFQIFPSLILIFLGHNTPLFWISCVLGTIALVIQNRRLPCFGTRIWSVGCVAGLLAVIWYVSYWAIRAGYGGIGGVF